MNSRNTGKHALEDSEEEIWHLGATHRWGSQYIPESEVLQITNVCTSGVGEGQRVSPEEPLEGYDADGHDREPYQREGGLAASETGVEEAGLLVLFPRRLINHTDFLTYPTPGIISKTSAVDVITQAISPDCRQLVLDHSRL